MSPPSTADKIKAGAADAYAQAKVPFLRPYQTHLLNNWLELTLQRSAGHCLGCI